MTTPKTRDQLLVYNTMCFLAEKMDDDADMTPGGFALACQSDHDILEMITAKLASLADHGEEYCEIVAESLDETEEVGGN